MVSAVALCLAVAFFVVEQSNEATPRIVTRPASTGAATTTPPTSAAADENVPPGVQIADLTWISESHGWALAVAPEPCRASCALVLTTTDGGDTWSRLSAPPACVSSSRYARCADNRTSVSQVRFANADVGYLFAPDFSMTTDGGDTWVTQVGRPVEALEPAGSTVVRISYSDTGCPGPCNATIDEATVGSSEWSTLREVWSGHGAQLVRPDVSDIYVASLGFITGGAGSAHAQLLASRDGGDSWSQHDDPCGASAETERDAAVVTAARDGVVGVLCERRDGGPQYVTISVDGAKTFGSLRPLPAIVAASGLSVMSSRDVVVANGALNGKGPFTYELYVSHDGAQHWTRAATETRRVDDRRIYSMFLGFESAGTGRWVADPRTVWTTTDGGDHWKPHRFR